MRSVRRETTLALTDVQSVQRQVMDMGPGIRRGLDGPAGARSLAECSPPLRHLARAGPRSGSTNSSSQSAQSSASIARREPSHGLPLRLAGHLWREPGAARGGPIRCLGLVVLTVGAAHARDEHLFVETGARVIVVSSWCSRVEALRPTVCGRVSARTSATWLGVAARTLFPDSRSTDAITVEQEAEVARGLDVRGMFGGGGHPLRGRP